MVAITVRDVPEQTRAELAARAARSGRSLQEYLRAELQALAERPDPEALLARVRERKRRLPSPLAPEEVVALLDEVRR